jgi:predicted GNAT family acetyltransferase
MSLYSQYLSEKTNDFILETEKGFATYRYTSDKTVYIIDLYVNRDFRKHGVASALADIIVEEARQKGCTELIGSVVPSARGSTDSLKVLLAYGMTLLSSSNDFIIFRKDL